MCEPELQRDVTPVVDSGQMTIRVEVDGDVLEWARARSGIDDETWERRFPRYSSWRLGEQSPTLKQLQEFARKTYTPVGFLFLDEPPQEKVPIPDFRTIGDRQVARGSDVPSADLLDVVYTAQARQEWYRDHQLRNSEDPLGFVGSASLGTLPPDAAQTIRESLDLQQEDLRNISSPDGLLTYLRERSEDAGVLVMISGIVGSNTHRKLDPTEFRGFALADSYAAMVFVNGADSKSAQVFTLAHELAHIWLGESAISDLEPASSREFDIERWCNGVAAELLVPAQDFRSAFDPTIEHRIQLTGLADFFNVSTQVILGRLLDLDHLSWPEFLRNLAEERERVSAFVSTSGSGGNYYNTKPVQVGKRFARSLISSTLEGQTSYTEAFRLLNLRKVSTFHGLAVQLGVS